MDMDYELFAFATDTDAFHHRHMDMMHAGASVGAWQAHMAGTIVKTYYRKHGRDYTFTRHDISAAAHMCAVHYDRQLAKTRIAA